MDPRRIRHLCSVGRVWATARWNLVDPYGRATVNRALLHYVGPVALPPVRACDHRRHTAAEPQELLHPPGDATAARLLADDGGRARAAQLGHPARGLGRGAPVRADAHL